MHLNNILLFIILKILRMVYKEKRTDTFICSSQRTEIKKLKTKTADLRSHCSKITYSLTIFSGTNV